jgi:hypothetical protein
VAADDDRRGVDARGSALGRRVEQRAGLALRPLAVELVGQDGEEERDGGLEALRELVRRRERKLGFR